MIKRKDYYYTPEEWSRSIGYGPVPDGRNLDLLDEECPELTKVESSILSLRSNLR